MSKIIQHHREDLQIFKFQPANYYKSPANPLSLIKLICPIKIIFPGINQDKRDIEKFHRCLASRHSCLATALPLFCIRDQSFQPNVSLVPTALFNHRNTKCKNPTFLSQLQIDLRPSLLSLVDSQVRGMNLRDSRVSFWVYATSWLWLPFLCLQRRLSLTSSSRSVPDSFSICVCSGGVGRRT